MDHSEPPPPLNPHPHLSFEIQWSTQSESLCMRVVSILLTTRLKQDKLSRAARAMTDSQSRRGRKGTTAPFSPRIPQYANKFIHRMRAGCLWVVSFAKQKAEIILTPLIRVNPNNCQFIQSSRALEIEATCSYQQEINCTSWSRHVCKTVWQTVPTPNSDKRLAKWETNWDKRGAFLEMDAHQPTCSVHFI